MNQPKTAEEILEKYPLDRIDPYEDYFSKEVVLKAMHEFREQERKVPTDEEFIKYIKQEKDIFINEVNKQEWNIELRVKAENFIIAFDQLEKFVRDNFLSDASAIDKIKNLHDNRGYFQGDNWEALKEIFPSLNL